MSALLEETTSDAEIASTQDASADPQSEREMARRRMASIGDLLATFLGYNQPDRPRPGSQVKDRMGHAGTVLGIARSGHALVACNTCDKITLDPCDRLQENRRYPRKSLTVVFARTAKLFLARGCRDHRLLCLLLSHLAGSNGKKYRDPYQLAWGVLLAMRIGDLDRFAKLKPFADEIVAEVRAAEGDLAELPLPLLRVADAEDPEITLADVAGMPDHPDLEQLSEGMVERMMVYLDRLKGIEADVRQQREIPVRAIGFDAMSGDDVVVLGPSLMESEPNWVDVVDLAGTQVYPAHLDDLELDDEIVEENDPELLGALHDAVMAGDIEAMWYLLNTPLLQAPDAALPRLLLAASAFRGAHEDTPTIARRANKQMYAIAKELPRELKSKVNAWVPELVNPKARKDMTPMGKASTLQPMLNEALWTLNWPIDPGLEESEARWGVEAREASAVDTPSAAHAEPAEAPVEGKPRARAQRPLACPVTEHPVLATEWSLPSTQDAADLATASTLQWLSERMGASLPTQWSTGWHEIEIGSVRLQVEAAGTLFAVRLEHPDSQHPTRTWRLEATVVRGEPGMVGLRLTARDRTALPKPFVSVPGLVAAWTSSPGLMLGDRRAGDALKISTHRDFFEARALLEDAERDFPVWVLPPASTVEVPAALASMVQVIRLTPAQLANYEKKLGAIPPKGFQAFPPHAKPFEAIADALDAKSLGRLKWATIAGRQRPATPTFRDVSAAIRDASSRRPEVASSTPEAAPPEEIHLPVRHERSDDQLLLELALGDKQVLERELEQAQEQIRQLRAKLHALQGEPEPSAEDLVADQHAVPEDLAGLARWAQSIAPRVVIADKALRHAMRTEHRDAPKIYAALQAMADHYWPMRWGDDPEARQRWLDFLQENRLRCGPIGQAAENQHYEGAYQAAFDGRMVGMTLHVQGSSSRDPLRCIRIYFHPDETTQQIRVGHLPTHLTNSLT